MNILENITLFLPECILICTILLTLLTGLFFTSKSVAYSIALSGLAIAGIMAFMLFNNPVRLLFSGQFIADDLAFLMKGFILLSAFLCFFYSNTYLKEHQMPRADYYVLGLLSTLGMLILVSAYSLLTIFLSLELLSLPLYTMTALKHRRKDNAEAALKYFVMGSMATGFMLYGMSFLFGITHTLGLGDLLQGLTSAWAQHSTMAIFALVFLISGFCFKLAAVPYHMWAPDVYQGAPTPVTLFIAAAPKIAALTIVLRILATSLISLSDQWQNMLLMIGLFSIGVGNILAIVQTNIKRLLAYSAIAHIGFALLGIAAITTEGYVAAIYYMVIYALMTVAAFGLLVLLSRNGIEVEQIEDLKGLNQRNPWLAFLMLITMFSMAGVPPTVGFFIKLLVLKALVNSGLTWIATLALLFTVIGVYYYIKVIMVMYFKKPSESAPFVMPFNQTLVLSLNALALLYYGIFPQAIINLCMSALAG